MTKAEHEIHVDKIIELERSKRQYRAESAQQTADWPKPKPLPNGLVPVDQFNSEFLRDALAPWVKDIANRLQCPPDYVAVTALTSLGAVINRRIEINPQAKTEWACSVQAEARGSQGTHEEGAQEKRRRQN
jgi:hypothetical protein